MTTMTSLSEAVKINNGVNVEALLGARKVLEQAPEAAQPKGGRKTANRTKPTKRAGRAKKPAAKPKTDRTNKKAEVIAMMKRPRARIYKLARDEKSRAIAPPVFQAPSSI